MTYPNEIAVEAPEADAAEQAQSAIPGRFDDGDHRQETSQDPEAPEWDAQEQREVVDLDDEYR